MFNRYALLICLFFIALQSQSQNKGLLPLTGIKYFSEGITAKDVEVRIDGSILLSNRIPLNKDFEIKLQSPAGFDNKANIVYAAAELTVFSSSGTVLGTIPNLLKDNETKGFAAGTFKELVIKLSLKPELIKAEATCVVKLRYYDLKSKKQLRVEFPVTIARAGEVLQLSKTVSDVKISSPFEARAVGLKIKNIDFSVDTTIRVNPKMAYASLDMTGIEGSSISEVLSGKESYWVYDADLNEIKMTDKQLKQVNGAMENNVVNYLSKIPFRLKTINKIYFIRFHWETADKRKMIDVVVSK